MNYALVTLGYLIISWLTWHELSVQRAPRRAFWLAMIILVAAWAWMIYSVSIVRPVSPLTAIDAIYRHIPGMRVFVSD